MEKNFHDGYRVKEEDADFIDETLYAIGYIEGEYIFFVAPLVGVLLHNAYTEKTIKRGYTDPRIYPQAQKIEILGTGKFEEMEESAKRIADISRDKYSVKHPAILWAYELLAYALNDSLHLWYMFPVEARPPYHQNPEGFEGWPGWTG